MVGLGAKTGKTSTGMIITAISPPLPQCFTLSQYYDLHQKCARVCEVLYHASIYNGDWRPEMLKTRCSACQAVLSSPGCAQLTRRCSVHQAVLSSPGGAQLTRWSQLMEWRESVIEPYLSRKFSYPDCKMWGDPPKIWSIDIVLAATSYPEYLTNVCSG